MKAISVVLLVFAFLFPFGNVATAQDSGCDDVLLANPELHDVALYLFAELDKEAFDRQSYVIAIIVYSNKITIEEDACGLKAQGHLLSWAFEVYRTKGNHYFKLINDEQYSVQVIALEEQREHLYEMYCEAYPIACDADGIPISYADLLLKATPPDGV